ncbi:hypothetical protein T07_7451 [Trichinella nelsoni]|uniref:Uncharacterized protein n=1 Tax=Trichinella nelsoni TaxID=6336 RepID=A0A0V0RTZ8_9BILA|nr:hypothetical protein T07_7451 [Trichinella nelsoni]
MEELMPHLTTSNKLFFNAIMPLIKNGFLVKEKIKVFQYYLLKLIAVKMVISELIVKVEQAFLLNASIVYSLDGNESAPTKSAAKYALVKNFQSRNSIIQSILLGSIAFDFSM